MRTLDIELEAGAGDMAELDRGRPSRRERDRGRPSRRAIRKSVAQGAPDWKSGEIAAVTVPRPASALLTSWPVSTSTAMIGVGFPLGSSTGFPLGSSFVGATHIQVTSGAVPERTQRT